MDYSELVKALRLCQFGECGCGKCYYKELKGDWCTEDNHPEFFDCDDKLKLDAAAAIEELQQIADHYEQTAKDYWKEACEYKAQLPKRGEWVVFNKQMLINLENAREQYKELGYPHRTELGLQCSNCRKVTYVDSGIKYEFCPHCGAKMEVQE